MDKRKDLPIGMGDLTETMIRELEFHFRLNAHDLIRKIVKDLDDPTTNQEFMTYNNSNTGKRVEKSSRIRGFKFKEAEVEEFIKMQWQCRIKGISTFIKQLIYFNYDKYIEPKKEG